MFKVSKTTNIANVDLHPEREFLTRYNPGAQIYSYHAKYHTKNFSYPERLIKTCRRWRLRLGPGRPTLLFSFAKRIPRQCPDLTAISVNTNREKTILRLSKRLTPKYQPGPSTNRVTFKKAALK